ncbi:MAG: M20/M25/M40 family metallo-hydrolase [Bacteroidia bacterium]|nr:M20/M25/M40 family metallo-hydrolase [Bacteroidia bacterium]MBP9688177.1 M20/M25/M40 family metallo-hydrolase [Bacteroidia bacterium]
MRKIVAFVIAFQWVSIVFGQTFNHTKTFKRIYDEVLTNGECYQTLDFLANNIGARLSGSPQAEKAVNYMFAKMNGYGFDTVFLQPVMVPHWVRGAKEEAFVAKGRQKFDVRICALGGSVATPINGIDAEVIEVKSLAELKQLGKKQIQGKIVFFNRPMEPTHIHTGAAYGGANDQRSRGPSEAAKYGAVGAVVRSLTLAIDDMPHTGMTSYNDSFPKIPACAISTNGADALSNLLKIKSEGQVRMFFKQNCETLPDVLSYNVIAEIKGSEFPNEIIIAGGHLDSWDLGQGAHDDGAGCVQSMEAIRLIKHLGLKPKRTLRAVLFMNEENGVKGGIEYARVAALNKQNKHIAAIESDAGGFTPRAFGIEDTNAVKLLKKWEPLYKPYSIDDIKHGWGGTDIGPLKKQGTVLIGYMPDSQRYFDYHHTEIDTFDKVNKRELELGAGAISTLMWLLSEEGLTE